MLKLQEATDPKTALKFKHENKSKDKSFVARMSYSDVGEPSVSLVSFTGYNEKYLSSRLQNYFTELRNFSALQIQTGDIILTRQYINDPPSPGTVVTLGSNTYYYSINGGLISCNGAQLEESINARFIKILNARCSAESAIMAYSQFKLL